jgi:hypothetical protein
VGAELGAVTAVHLFADGAAKFAAKMQVFNLPSLGFGVLFAGLALYKVYECVLADTQGPHRSVCSEVFT